MTLFEVGEPAHDLPRQIACAPHPVELGTRTDRVDVHVEALAGGGPIAVVVLAFAAEIHAEDATIGQRGDDGQIGVKDLGSANGTFVKINGSSPVSPGDLLLVGEQILRVDPA